MYTIYIYMPAYIAVVLGVNVGIYGSRMECLGVVEVAVAVAVLAGVGVVVVV